MKIVCTKDEFARLIRWCTDNWVEDNCQCCVLRHICDQRTTSDTNDIEKFLELTADPEKE